MRQRKQCIQSLLGTRGGSERLKELRSGEWGWAGKVGSQVLREVQETLIEDFGT